MKTQLKNHVSRKLITAHHSTTVAEAYSIMKNNWIRHLPVHDDSKVICGIISDRDLLSADSNQVEIREIMSQPVVTYDIETSMRTIVRRMIEDKMSAFLITKKSEVFAIVTTEDLLLLLAQLLNDELDEDAVFSSFLTNPLFQQSIRTISDAGL